jgi:ADP-heptose:LPS heptosyltransferase
MRILVMRVGRIGDVVMVIPTLNALLEKYSTAEIHVLTSPHGQRVLNGFDNRIRDIITYDRKKLLQFFARRRLTRRISQLQFTHIYCLETNT